MASDRIRSAIPTDRFPCSSERCVPFRKERLGLISTLFFVEFRCNTLNGLASVLRNILDDNLADRVATPRALRTDLWLILKPT